MKKLLPFLIAFIFSSTINAQAPALNVVNVTGSSSITCAHPSINYQASVSNYTAGTLTYTWVSLSGTASGTNVTLSNPAQYTVMAFNVANSFSIQQVFSIGINTTIPTSTVNPMAQSITCPVGSPATFTGITTSTATNITHSWYSVYSAQPTISGGTITIQSMGAPGTYTYCVINNINGCSTCKTVTVTSTSAFPTFSVMSTSTPQFTLGCGSNSLSSINISNVNTYAVPSGPPTGGPVSYTVLPPSFTGPSYGFGGASSYSVNAPGQYTVIVKDNTNNCETKVTVSVIQNTVGPNINISVPTQTLSCYTSSTILSGSSTNTAVVFSWASSTSTLQQVTSNIPVSTTSNVASTVTANYTLTVTDPATMCKSTQTITIFQNTTPPTAVINPINPGLTCITPSVNLTNASTSNVPPVFSPVQPVIGLLWVGPAPQASLANSSNYIAYTGGVYSLTAQDLNNGCTTIATRNVTDGRIYPIVSSPTIFNINCPVGTATIFPTLTGPTTGFTYSWSAPPTASTSPLTSSVITVNMPGDYTITVANPVNGCSTTTVVSVAVCAGISQNQANASLISVFPNPTNSIITVDVTKPAQITSIEIYSTMGILVKKQVIIDEKTIIDLQKEANGIYFIHVLESGKTIKVAKIVKQ